MPIFEVGETIPDLKMANSRGELQPLSQQMGEKGLLIMVLRGTWCPSCLMQLKNGQRYYARYVEQGVNSLFITPEEEDKVWSFKVSQPRPLQFGLHADPLSQAVKLFLPAEGIGVLPAAYLLNRERQVVWRHIGQDLEDRPSHAQLLEAFSTHLSEAAILLPTG